MQFVKVRQLPALPATVSYTEEKLMDDLDCGYICLEVYPECASYIYNVTDYACHFARSPLDLVDVYHATNNAHLYAGCDLGRGFSIQTLNDTQACLSKVFTEQTYDNASNICRDMGGYLVSMKTSVKQQLLRNLMTDAGTEIIWLGLNDKDVEGEYVWEEDGTVFGPEEVVAALFDVENILANCVLMKGPELGDVECEKELNFICEMMINI
ncbi:brevican core protein [Elysia marginata]|uniref:Brevican core protein n=1 Tax=Elysia marginata TaxID=1093978 RepID=A0AAV4H7Y0_9GAST|nr:brevican core protein [Elysia marginata]